MESISHNLKKAYNDLYQDHDEAWRMLGAKYKAHHIITVCKGQTFNKILEVGSGDGSVLKKLSEYNFGSEYHAVDVSESAVAYTRARNIKNLISVQVVEGYQLPFADNSFDLVILSHVLEHAEHERILLREIKRLSKHVVIEVSVDYKTKADKRIEHFLSYGLINIYTPTTLRYLLQTEGYKIKTDMYSIIWPEVTRYNTFINQKKPGKFIDRFKILAAYAIKNTIVELSDSFRERLANAYTVLCTTAGNQPGIFNQTPTESQNSSIPIY
ncbi:class I SAM-dependent methyltransferase [Mucilaginibacter sp. AK015]|uniref:class I SAM-dependent methyltransferase n=1 Tax=Mucilaginibacter sp. AK015 TaxID=2723072 RepID=UPI00161385CA|nr:class I SAM-dependent methyltransferase [Mucilaginibacter sp. AK015]MBB5396531.1 ubiquinone/menaquinone biosynthesis C-methylase UbiE [Mucilaginibacter sp. AK015]